MLSYSSLAFITLLSVGAVADAVACCVPRSDDFVSPSLSAPEHQQCPANAPLSCSSGTTDSCCYEGTNGLFLSTQFWDYNPATGPDDVWTLHGLWSDKCSGGYNQFCHPSWAVKNVTSTLLDLGYNKLLETMQTNWKNMNGNDESLWQHEFAKHATCMSTVNPACYSSSAPKYQYVGDFFTSAVALWAQLPSYKFLTDAGITPSTTQTYTVQQFQDALSAHVDNSEVYLGCDRNNAITEIWYFFHLKGSVADGTFIPTDSITSSSCTDGFKWLPKTGNGGGGGGDDDGSTTSGNLKPSGQPGCLISDGSWFTSGTCATFKVTETVGGVSVSSSKGPCGVDGQGKFQCGSSVSSSDFTLDENNNLVYGGSDAWSANSQPSGQSRAAVYSGSGSINFQINFAS
ncbi:Ribonuclease T2-like [Wickerhamiella sorbophila]|uniref:ribonuclease T2 n=1 Tax=Wickerhamiella sorbophila TaxID=45607 RepID=A0A2T0FFJ0_9ASCO|nr:Ribonuclease T2-like [Wickerhamiella sorbophila]PRT53763.1 Ribonuclease T2-like [Wickerhamiella sorbophila]